MAYIKSTSNRKEDPTTNGSIVVRYPRKRLKMLFSPEFVTFTTSANYITSLLEALHQKIINQKQARQSPALLDNIIENYISRIRVRAVICFKIRSLPLSN